MPTDQDANKDAVAGIPAESDLRTTPHGASSRAEVELLCERCGYPLTGIPKGGVCPECGTPIHKSLPRRRIGTRWQRADAKGERRFPRVWWRTGLGVLFAPRRTLDAMRDATVRYDNLVGTNLNLASLPTTIACAFAIVTVYAMNQLAADVHASDASVLRLVLPALLFGATVGAIGYALSITLFGIMTVTEEAGMRFFSVRRKHRLTSGFARAIVAHASYGWVVSGLGLGLVIATLPIGFILDEVRQDAGLHGDTVPNVFRFVGVPGLVLIALGFVIFEVFAYLGTRRLRYANPTAAGSVAEQ